MIRIQNLSLTTCNATLSPRFDPIMPKAGAIYVIIFYNRVKDAGEDADRVVRKSCALLGT